MSTWFMEALKSPIKVTLRLSFIVSYLDAFCQIFINTAFKKGTEPRVPYEKVYREWFQPMKRVMQIIYIQIV